MTTANSYDEVPYASLPFVQTHPQHLAAIATLYGLDPPPLAGCRVLELGCAAGGNLVPLAEQLPGAELVGVDLSMRQVEQGRQLCAAVGLDTVRLVAASIDTIDASYGEFDYILCHGVYSWVPESIRAAILRVCHERLRPHGIAYVSYNTLPGWRMRGTIRDLMRQHALGFASPAEQVAQARAILDFLAETAPAEDDAYSALLRREVAQLRHAPDAYIFHEHLEAENEPIYFRDFVARAAHHGLDYLAEADFGAMFAEDLAPDAAALIERIAPDLVGRQQLLDFVRNRSFRQSLLVHAGSAIDRRSPLPYVDRLRLASALRLLRADAQGAAFALDDGREVSSTAALSAAALGVLAEAWPADLDWATMLARARRRLVGEDVPNAADERALRVDLLRCFAAGMLELGTAPVRCTATLAARPRVSRLARAQAEVGPTVTTQRHRVLTLDDAARMLLRRLDGTCTAPQLAALLRAAYPTLDDTHCGRLLEAFRRAALLVD